MLSQKEIEAILEDSLENRVKYSIKRIADREEVWVIGDKDGLGTFSDENGNIIFPIWPFKEFAQLCCSEAYSEYVPELIALEDFLEIYLPKFEKNNYKIAILPLPSGKGGVMEINSFKDALDEELEKY